MDSIRILNMLTKSILNPQILKLLVELRNILFNLDNETKNMLYNSNPRLNDIINELNNIL